MRSVRLCRLGLAVGLAVLAIFAGVSQAAAQDRANFEIVPHIPHSLRVRSIAFSFDGERVLSGSNDKTMKLWDRSGTAAETVQDFEFLMLASQERHNRTVQRMKSGPCSVYL